MSKLPHAVGGVVPLLGQLEELQQLGLVQSFEIPEALGQLRQRVVAGLAAGVGETLGRRPPA